MRQLLSREQIRNNFGVFDRGRTHQYRLSAPIAFANVVYRGLVFFSRGFVHPIELIATAAGAIRGNHHRLKAVNFLKLVGLGVCRTRHARKLAVQAEIVLESDGGQGLVFGLDRHTLFGLHRLVQAFAPAPPGHQATGKFVHDHDLTLLHHIVLVPVVQMGGAQSRIHMVHQADVGRVIQGRACRNQVQAREQALGAFMALLGEEDLLGFFIEREIARGDHAFAGAQVQFALLALERRNHGVDSHVHGGMVFGLAADDQWRARLVDQNRIDLVHDGEVQSALYPVCDLVHHVVAQVVKTVFVVGAVGDVRPVSGLFVGARRLRRIDPHAQAQKAVKLPHPARIASGQVVVDRHHMHAFTG